MPCSPTAVLDIIVRRNGFQTTHTWVLPHIYHLVSAMGSEMSGCLGCRELSGKSSQACLASWYWCQKEDWDGLWTDRRWLSVKPPIQAQDRGTIINLSEAEWHLMMDIFTHYEPKHFPQESGTWIVLVYHINRPHFLPCASSNKTQVSQNMANDFQCEHLS